MASEQKRSRRKLLLVAGAASLGILGLVPSRAQASKFPKLDKALVDLREARNYLQNAPDMFGGHKKNAVQAITTAINEIQAAIKFAS